MNVFDAINELEHLNDKATALDFAIGRIEPTHDYCNEIRLLNEIKNDLTNQATELKSRLEKTQLSNIR